MKRIMLRIAYDGTNYKGWQKQPDQVTIEGLLNNRISKVLGENIEIIGASRTDAGVHALSNVAVFDTKTQIPAEKLALALNRRLPRDIVIQESKEVSPYFHPRDCKSIKTYEYHIYTTRHPLPTKRLYSYHVPHKLIIADMKKAAKYLIGTHDFKSFCLKKTQTLSTVRTIYKIDIIKDTNDITFTVTGNGFLYNMVRCIIGTLIYVGRGVYPPDHVKEILNNKDRQVAGPNAPAQGLVLTKTQYLVDEENLTEDNVKKVSLRKQK